jgi:hypothetical protein
MSGSSEDQALEQGHECAMAALKTDRERVAALPSPVRLYWWFGFLTAALGAALASLGEPATRALRASLADNPEAPARRLRADPELSLVRRGSYLRDELPPEKKKKA